MTRIRSLGAGSALVAALTLNGCLLDDLVRSGPSRTAVPGVVAAKTYRFEATSQYVSGKTTTNPPKTQYRNLTQNGSFESTGASRGAGVVFSKGRYANRYSGESNSNTGKGNVAGHVLVDFKRARDGLACFRYEMTVKRGGERWDGTGKLVGGTKKGAKLRGSADFTGRRTNAGGVSPVSATGNLRKVKRGKDMPKPCKRLKSAL